MRIGIHLPASRLHGGRRLPPSEVPPNSRADHERMTHEKSPQRPTTNASPEPQTAPQGGQPVVSSTITRDGLGGDGGGWAGGGACRGAAGLPPPQPRRWGLRMGRLGCSARSPNEPRVPQPTWLQAARQGWPAAVNAVGVNHLGLVEDPLWSGRRGVPHGDPALPSSWPPTRSRHRSMPMARVLTLLVLVNVACPRPAARASPAHPGACPPVASTQTWRKVRGDRGGPPAVNAPRPPPPPAQLAPSAAAQ